MRKTFLCLFSALILTAGCGGEGDMLDGGALDGGTTDLAGQKLQSGTYDVSDLMVVKNECENVYDSFKTVPVANTGTELQIGKLFDNTTSPQWDPPGYSLGSGTYDTATTATLSVTAKSTDTDTDCTYDLTRTSKVTFTGMNMLSVDFTDNQSNFSAGCGVSFKSCTTNITFNLTKQP